MTKPSLRGRVVAKFPSRIEAGDGITITKTNQTYTFSATGGGSGGIGEAPTDGQQYGRQNAAWTLISGGGVTASNPLIIEKGTTSPPIAIISTVGGLNRWRLNLGDSEVETGVAGGSDFHLDSYNNDGTYRNLVIHADRDTSEVTITSGPAPHHAILTLNKLNDGQAATVQGKRSGGLRWGMALGDGVNETGGSAGSNFRINSYDDNGNFLGAPFFIERSTGKVQLTGGATAGTPILSINKLVSGQTAAIQGQLAGVARWQLSLGDVLGESGTASGSDFRINRYNNAGTLIDAPLWVRRDTGTVTLTGTHPPNEAMLAINKTAGGMAATIQGQTATSPRWDVILGDGVGEGGGNTGSDFRIHRYSNAGAFLDVPLWIKRSTGETVIQGSPPDQKALLILNKTSGAGGQSSSIQGQTATSTRWHLALGDGGAEAGLNSGSDFRIHRHDDSGNFIDAAMYIQRSSLLFAVYGDPYSPGGGLWNAISDSRIKTVQGDYTGGLAQVLALHPVRYIYKGNDSPGPNFPSNHAAVAARNQEFIGLVAQEAETVMPEMVSQKTAYIDGVQVTDMRAMDTSALIYALVNAVKELSARVEALEAAP